MTEDLIIKGAFIHRMDLEAREMISILETRLETINIRTKNHTRYIKQLEKEIKEFKKNGNKRIL